MMTTRTLCLGLVCSVLLTSGSRAEEVPNFKKKGDLEKKFVSDTCVAIIKAARPSAKSPSLHRFEYKEPKANRKDLHIKGKFSGVLSGSEYTADIVVHIDCKDPNSWEVLRIEYEDNSKNVVGPNRKNLDHLMKKFNGD
jgi:hypothetical protein